MTLELEEGVELARLTTIGTGGPARAFARVASVGALEAALAWARERELPSVAVGLGSNVLAADAGVEALVVRLGGGLAEIAVTGETLVAGGGAANAVCLHRARAAGLGGLEFACAIPGTAGGGVRMNAGAYGSDWSTILERALVVTADGAGWLTAAELGLEYRRSALRTGEVVARVEYRLQTRPPAEIKAEVADLVARRKATQPTNKRTFGSVFKNPPGEHGAGRLLELCGLKGLPRRRRGRLSPARELHRERGWRDNRRLPRPDRRGATTGPRAVRRRARAGGRRAGRSGGGERGLGNRLHAQKKVAWHAGDEQGAASRSVRGRRASSSRSRARCRVIASSSVGSFPPAAPSPSPSRCWAGFCSPFSPPARHRSSGSARST